MRPSPTLDHAVRIVAALIAVGIVGGLVAGSGIIGLRASTGHYAVTRAFLEFSMDRSIATNSMFIDVPELDEDWTELAAGHYALWCETCHGHPGNWDRALTRVMMPPPPPLDVLDDEQRMYFVVRHGLKFTGMPGWPSQVREDEVWVMVSLLRQLDDLDAEGYHALVDRPDPRETEAPDVVVRVCAACHGLDGETHAGGRVPRLAGQHEEYLAASLEAYARLERASGFMAPVADALTPAERSDAAAWYAVQEAEDRPPPVDPALAARGRRIARDGIPEDRVPACAQCHGPRELADVPDNPRYPVLAGQHPTWLRIQLELFRRGVRGGTPYHVLMREVTAHELDDEAIAAVSAYYGGL